MKKSQRKNRKKNKLRSKGKLENEEKEKEKECITQVRDNSEIKITISVRKMKEL